MDTHTEEDVTRTTFVLPKSVHRRFKMVLLRNGQTMQEFLEQIVERYVEREEGKAD